VEIRRTWFRFSCFTLGKACSHRGLHAALHPQGMAHEATSHKLGEAIWSMPSPIHIYGLRLKWIYIFPFHFEGLRLKWVEVLPFQFKLGFNIFIVVLSTSFAIRLIISTSFLKCFQISPALANFLIIHAQSCLIGRSKTHQWMVCNCDTPLICVLQCYQLEIYTFISYWSFFVQLGELSFI